MARIKFPKGEQRAWLINILQKRQISPGKLAKLCGFHSRTLNDWLREEYTLPEKAATIIVQKTNISLPGNAQRITDYWNIPNSSKLGAMRRMELYGFPGTKEGRKKGGHISQLRRLLYPDKYQNCKIRKDYIWPEKSELLAELCGIILGDGGISHDQVKITLNYYEETDYVKYVSNLINNLFGQYPALYLNKNQAIKACNLTLSGIKLIEFLISLGLDRGSKVKRQAAVPEWIIKSSELSVATLRGLVDTDGGIYSHKHEMNLKSYFNIGLTFTSHSSPLLDFVDHVLVEQAFNPKRSGEGVYLYRLDEVLKYQKLIGFGNNHHTERLNNLLLEKLNWKGVRVV